MPKDMNKIMEKRLNQVTRIDEECRKLFALKNTQYKDTIARTGVLGAVVEVIGISARLEALVLQDPSHGKDNAEALHDVVADLHNYSNIIAMMMEDQNWSGE